MKVQAEGYIKFNCRWTTEDIEISKNDFEILSRWRNKLFALKLIGAYPEGIGFGNISKRTGLSGQFIISGSATGVFPVLTQNHYALVTDYSLKDNSLSCTGQVKASSESLSHAAIYETGISVNAVIHVHHKKLWELLKNTEPTTNEQIPYGTPAMAKAIADVMKKNNLQQEGIIVMGGHEEGILAFGNDMDSAGNILLGNFHRLIAH